MTKIIVKNKWLGIGLIIFFLFFILPKISLAAEGDLIWAQTSNPSSNWDDVADVAIDSTGLYVIGNENGGSQWRVEKRNLSDGSLIWKQTINPTPNQDIGTSITVDNTGVYTAGLIYYKHSEPADTAWRVEKRNLSDGSLIWFQIFSFFNSMEEALGLAADNTGIYVVGYQNEMLVARVEKRNPSDGSLIWSRAASYDRAEKVAIDSTGLYVIGNENGGSQWRVEKRNLSDGSLIWNQIINPTVYWDFPVDVAIDSTGVYVVGGTGNYYWKVGQWRVEKRSLSDGSLIWNQTIDPTPNQDSAASIIIDSVGVYVVGHIGYNYYASPNDVLWRMEKRNLTDGKLIWSKSINPSSGRDFASGVAIDSSGIYVAGYDSVLGNYQWRIEKREILPAYIDCGLRIKETTGTVAVACEPAGTLTSPLRIRKGATTYGIVLVDPTDSNASKTRVKTNSGIKALRKY